jgi:hypothetical protein
MHPKRVVINRVSVVIAAVVAIIVVAIIVVAVIVVVGAAVGAFGSLLLGKLFPILQIIVISSDGHPRARATIIGIVATP